jgi:hypothetical protein
VVQYLLQSLLDLAHDPFHIAFDIHFVDDRCNSPNYISNNRNPRHFSAEIQDIFQAIAYTNNVVAEFDARSQVFGVKAGNLDQQLLNRRSDLTYQSINLFD